MSGGVRSYFRQKGTEKKVRREVAKDKKLVDG